MTLWPFCKIVWIACLVAGVISFWVFRGMLSGSIELIYSSVDESLIYANESGHPITNVKKLKDHWYLVDTDY